MRRAATYKVTASVVVAAAAVLYPNGWSLIAPISVPRKTNRFSAFYSHLGQLQADVNVISVDILQYTRGNDFLIQFARYIIIRAAIHMHGYAWLNNG